MPGLIDCHVHVIASIPDLGRNAELPNTLVALRSAKIMARDADARLSPPCATSAAPITASSMAMKEGRIEAPRS